VKINSEFEDSAIKQCCFTFRQ
jgi:hypothetical protein